MTSDRRELAWRAGLVLGLGALIAYLVAGHGVPLLRHDWGIPASQDSLRPAIASLFQPWLDRGIGSAQPYPTAYLLGFVIAPWTWLSPSAFAWALVFAIAALIATGGLEVSRALAAPRLAQVACALFAILNPWTYSEFVAGHVFMLASFGFVVLLCAEILRPQPRAAALILLSALLITQIEFFALGAIPVAVWLLRSGRYAAVASMGLAALPIAFGIASHYHDLLGIPYTLAWQRVQSVPVLDALQLRGYFAGYDGGFSTLWAVLWSFAAFGLVATWLSARRGAILAFLLVGWAAVVASTGTKWIIAGLYSAVVVAVTESGLFRELYDLLAFATLGYVVAIAVVAARFRATAPLALGLSMTLLLPWLSQPPFDWFVPQRDVPSLALPETPDARVALYPAFQPLQYRGLGSGLDPDMFEQDGRAIPINDAFPNYPAANALAVSLRGDPSQLAALAVGSIVERPYFEQADGKPARRSAPARPSDRSSTRAIAAYPLLGIVDGEPPVAAIARDPRRTATFFGDAPSGKTPAVRDFLVIPAPRLSTEAADAWIDARLAFRFHPEIATRFGGAFTTSRSPLPIARGAWILAWTDGRLLSDDGRTIARRSGGLAWKSVPDDTTSVRCAGSCAVIGTADRPPARAEGPLLRPRRVRFEELEPWLLRAAVPDHAPATLRLAMRYETSWTLLGAGAEHVRLAGDLNGWVLERGPARSALLINVAAGIQMLLEAFAAVGIVALALAGMRSAGRNDARPQRRKRAFRGSIDA